MYVYTAIADHYMYVAVACIYSLTAFWTKLFGGSCACIPSQYIAIILLTSSIHMYLTDCLLSKQVCSVHVCTGSGYRSDQICMQSHTHCLLIAFKVYYSVYPIVLDP